MYEIILYNTEDGTCPMQELLDSLEAKLLARSLRSIDLLEKNGSLVMNPYSDLDEWQKELLDELPVEQELGLYFFIMSEQIILTNGVVKSPQYIPLLEKELARKYQADYQSRFYSSKISNEYEGFICSMCNYKDYKKKALQNPMVKAEYDTLQPEYDEKQLTISTRDHFKRQIQQNITQEAPLRPIRMMIPLLFYITNFWRR